MPWVQGPTNTVENRSNIIKTCEVWENLVLRTWKFSVHLLLPGMSAYIAER